MRQGGLYQNCPQYASFGDFAPLCTVALELELPRQGCGTTLATYPSENIYHDVFLFNSRLVLVKIQMQVFPLYL